MKTVIALSLLFASGAIPHEDRPAPQNVGRELNNMLRVGFRIFDPEGFEIHRFDE
jgi:hypothetical protein